MTYFSILGDSISTFSACNPEGYAVYYEDERCIQTGVLEKSDTWWAQVIEHFGGTLLKNASFSGSLIEGDDFPAGCSQERICALADNDIVPDVIVVCMGINDYGCGGASSKTTPERAACIKRASSEGRSEKKAHTSVLDKFTHAYELLLERAQATYPSAEIWCCTLCPGRVAGAAQPTFTGNLRGTPFEHYNSAIRSCAQKHGVFLLDLAARGFDYEALDGTHPTARGMNQLAHLVIKSREIGLGSPSKTLDAALFDASLASAEICPDQLCLNCTNASNTGANWLLVCRKHIS